ncbi:MAG: Zn-ribbon domain-containing OB-fold protein [Dehalococcoidia bacterium]|nr:MAG: Zn-ribbon domain-containing OB-fold protein [Dehalococcoidia bacterium]
MTVQYNPEYPTPRPAQWGVLYRSSTGFWEGVKRHELVIQKCKQCGTWLHPPRPMCPNCRSAEHDWVPSKGKGTVYSWVTYHESPHPGFKAPYSVVLVELEEGVRLISNLIDVLPDDIYIGMPVEVVFDDIAEDMTLPKFRRVV